MLIGCSNHRVTRTPVELGPSARSSCSSMGTGTLTTFSVVSAANAKQLSLPKKKCLSFSHVGVSPQNIKVVCEMNK